MENTIAENSKNMEIMENMKPIETTNHTPDAENLDLSKKSGKGACKNAGAREALRSASGARHCPLLSARFAAPPLEILRGLREIAAFLQISHAEVLELENSGAPIVRRKNVLRAEKRELWSWFRGNN